MLLQRNVDLLTPEVVAMKERAPRKLGNEARKALLDPVTQTVLEEISKDADDRPYRPATTTALIGLNRKAIEEAGGL